MVECFGNGCSSPTNICRITRSHCHGILKKFIISNRYCIFCCGRTAIRNRHSVLEGVAYVDAFGGNFSAVREGYRLCNREVRHIFLVLAVENHVLINERTIFIYWNSTGFIRVPALKDVAVRRIGLHVGRIRDVVEKRFFLDIPDICFGSFFTFRVDISKAFIRIREVYHEPDLHHVIEFYIAVQMPAHANITMACTIFVCISIGTGIAIPSHSIIVFGRCSFGVVIPVLISCSIISNVKQILRRRVCPSIGLSHADGECLLVYTRMICRRN